MKENGSVKAIEIKVTGFDQHNGAARLSVFRDKLDALTRALNGAERHVARVGQAKSNFLINDLQYSSAYAKIAPYADGAYLGSVEAVNFIGDVLAGVDADDGRHIEAPSFVFSALKDICKGHGQHYKDLELAVSGARYKFDEVFSVKIQKYIERKYSVYGEVKGKLDQVNLHDKEAFTIYPEHGRAISCTFDAVKMLDDVALALGRVIIARGRLEFIGADADPVSAYVESFEVMPKDYVIPRHDSLFGAVPDISGDMEIDEYIRNFRGEWDRH